MSNACKNISILGSTGSIGTQTLDIVKHFPNRFNIIGLAAGKNIALLKEQLINFKPQIVSIQNEAHQQEVQQFITDNKLKTDVTSGQKGLEQIATTPCDLLVVAVVGTAAIKPTYLAIQNGIPIGLACKEVLVSAGDLIMKKAAKHNVPIIPIDSEHAAIKQCLSSVNESLMEVTKLILTASGGPFWQKEQNQFESITKEDALKHPNWEMGAKITIDSATMMNKGLEVIEAHHLFNCPYSKIDVTIHPQSIIHSLVEFTDGTMLAQMGLPDMRFPIQYALTYPEKWKNPWPKTSLTKLKDLQFFEPDYKKFPLLKMAFELGKEGTQHTAVMNAANESYVGLFLAKQIGFNDIYRGVQKAVEQATPLTNPSIDDIVALDYAVKEKIKYQYA